MKIVATIIKRFMFFFFIVFASYLFVVNFTLTSSSLLDGVIKSLLLALLTMPLSVVSLFPANIADKSICYYTIYIERPLEEGIKLVRQFLKTLNNISLLESDMEKATFQLESEFSHIQIEVRGQLDSSFILCLASKPKPYLNINNYNFYQKDLKNIIQLLKINIDDDSFDLDEFDIINREAEVIQIMKTFNPLKYRYYKILIVFLLTLVSSMYCYNYFLQNFPSVSTIFFFASFIMYIFYILSNELVQIKQNIRCPECKNPIYSDKSIFVLQHTKNNCTYCDKLEY